MSVLERDAEKTSICGSISGETYVSRRSRNACTLRHRAATNLATLIREQHCQAAKPLPGACSISQVLINKSRFNSSFHHLRFVVATLGGLAVGLMLTLRYNISVAVLSMVNYTALYLEDHPNATAQELGAQGQSKLEDGEFAWNNQVQQIIMSFYMIAHTLPQVPLTKWSTIIGARWSIPAAMSLCALSTILTPPLAHWGWQWVVVLRLLNGLGSGPILPMALEIVEKWMPYQEIAIGLTCCQLVQAFMQAINPLLVGFLCHLDWRYAFYVPGFISLAFCLIWIIVISDHPDDSWLISLLEVDTICGCKQAKRAHEQPPTIVAIEEANRLSITGLVEHKTQAGAATSGHNQEPPSALVDMWDILRQPSCFGYLVIWSLYSVSCTCFNFMLPTYLGQFLDLSTAQIGSYCFLISTGVLVSMMWPQPFLCLVRSALGLSKTAASRTAYWLLSLVVALSWIYVGRFHELQLATLFVNRCFQNSMDIVVVASLMANYAPAGVSSLMFSLVNSVGNFSVVFVSPLIGCFLDYTDKSDEGWSWVYYAFATMQLLTLLFFNTLINAEPIQFEQSKQQTNKNKKDAQPNQMDLEAKVGAH